MKNKKLFAILTLVCFMMTLMPVAAFAADTVYAEVNEDSEIVTVGDDIVLDITNGAAGAEYYLFAMKNDSVNKGLGITTGSAINGQITIENGVSSAGTYDIYVIDQTPYTTAIVAKYNRAELTRDEAAARLIKESNVVMLGKSVIVKPTSTEYTLTIDKASGGALSSDGKTLTLAANSGYTEIDVYAKLVDSDDKAVVGATLKVSTNSSAVDVSAEEVKTNAAGLAKFTVSSSIAGDFKVYVEYGTKADCELNVKANGLAAANITTIKQPKAPVALDSTLDKDIDVRFNVTDANGNNTVLNNNYRVAVTQKPAGSKISAEAITLTATSNGWAFAGDETLDEEGTYSFRVILNNGNYATATVEVKEFQKPVELTIEYPTAAVELNGTTEPEAINFVDANGVTKKATGVELSASGYAIKDFSSASGKLSVKPDEKYVGSAITVLAVSTKYNLTATANLVVAKEAAAVKYANTKADVAVNNTLVANIVDEDGNKVALNSAAATNNTTIQYVVLEKPENAKVAITTKNDADLVKKGEFKVSFTASAIGNYKIQTVVRYEQAGTTGQVKEPVVKYYAGTETITVGNTGFEDIVVMSIGSNEIVVNANKVAIDAAPMVQNSRTYVPFRALAEAFGATVAYDEATQAVTAELNGTTVVMTIGSATYTINGVEKTMDVAPFINGSRTMIPVRFAAEAFGITVTPTYDNNGATADVLFAK